MFSISFRKYRDEEKEKLLVYFYHQNVNYLPAYSSSQLRPGSKAFIGENNLLVIFLKV